MNDISTTSAPSTADPDQIIKRYKGMKVDEVGAGSLVLELLMINASLTDIEEAIKKEYRVSIGRATIQSWIQHQTDELKKQIQKEQYEQLRNEVWDFERKGMQVRNEADKKIKDMIETEEDFDSLTPKQKNELGNLIMKRVQIQESGEKFMGLQSPGGKRYNLDINVNVDIVDQLRQLTTERMKKKAIDVESEDVEGE